eukprot:4629533-Amphidinium_carterae.1
MKAHQTQAVVDRDLVIATDLHGNGQADLFANQGTVAHGPLAPDDDSEPRIRLPAETPAENPADTGIVGMVFPAAPLKLGPHLRVIRHAEDQCLECGRQTGKVKGEYNFSYLKRQDCRKLNKKKVK